MNAKENEDSEMLEEYDFSGGVRGKYADRVLANNSKRLFIRITDGVEISGAIKKRPRTITKHHEKKGDSC